VAESFFHRALWHREAVLPPCICLAFCMIIPRLKESWHAYLELKKPTLYFTVVREKLPSLRPPLALPSLRAASSNYQSPHPSSSPPDRALAPPPGFRIAAVPTLVPFFAAPLPTVVLGLDSPAAAKSSQNAFLSELGPLGSAPNDSQKSSLSESGLTFRAPVPAAEELACSSPSTKRLKASEAPCWRFIACWRAWAAKSASESC
jgi:hypothetical protein